MTSTTSQRDQYSDAELAERYTDQPARLPDGVRAELSRALDGEPLLAYAFVDLNEELELCERWLALSRHWLVTIGGQSSGRPRIERVPRAPNGARRRGCSTNCLGRADDA